MRQRYPIDVRARLGILGVALLLAIPALTAPFADHSARSNWENRPLAPFPALRGDAAHFFGDVDRFLDDHYGLAVPINRLYRRAVFYGFRDSPSRALSIGDDGFLFVNMGPAAPARFDAFQVLCSEATDPAVIEREWPPWIVGLQRLRKQGHRVGVAIAPSKQVVYPEKLPTSVPRIHREACSRYAERPSLARRLVEEGQQRKLAIVYPLDEFRERRYDGNFYPREQFHVLDHAGHVLGLALLRGLRMEPPRNYFPFRDGVVVSNDLARLLGFPFRISTRIYDYAPSRPRRVAMQPAFVPDYYARARDWGTIVSERAYTRRTALIVSNSFGRAVAKHIAPAYRSTTWINVNDLQPEERARFFAELLPRIDPDDLLFVVNDTVLAEFSSHFPEPPPPHTPIR